MKIIFDLEVHNEKETMSVLLALEVLLSHCFLHLTRCIIGYHFLVMLIIKPL